MKVDFFKKNRQKLFGLLDKSVVVLSAYSSLQRSNDASFAFEQEANFWYLTGIEHADWKLVLTPEKSWLVAPDVDAIHQVFEGGLTFADAKKVSGVDEVISLKDVMTLMKDLALEYDTVYTLGKDPHAEFYDFILNPAQQVLTEQLEKIFKDVKDCRLELSRLRSIKQPDEIAQIRKAIDLTVTSFRSVKSQLPDFTYEYEVEAKFSYLFRKTGATGHAYDPIVGGGSNACTLHYTKNSGELSDASLVLIDIGARVNGYAADVTRTYAIGEPTQRQCAVHAAVESAHEKIIALLSPGFRVADYRQSVDEIMQDALVSLGLMKSREDIASYRTYFPHAISHGLGIDVHDSLGGAEVFKPGMVLTVEPGIYIPEEGIGVRIEDDILITETGHENLSGALSTSL